MDMYDDPDAVKKLILKSYDNDGKKHSDEIILGKY
jgi:hypothetical protein